MEYDLSIALGIGSINYWQCRC